MFVHGHQIVEVERERERDIRGKISGIWQENLLRTESWHNTNIKAIMSLE
jgi:hypothetical protein